MEWNSFKKIIFPRGFAVAIDDLGWNEGSNLSKGTPPGPHRAGVKRIFDLNDYKHVVAVGKAVGARIQSLFILSEMDRENVLAKYPTTTYQRSRWNNAPRVSNKEFVIMDYVKQQAAFMEFGFHGTGHEYWADDGIQRRAEWYNLIDRKPWPEHELRNHIQGFIEIMAQYDITSAKGHSFPESFVPCAYSYYWNPNGDYSLGKLLSEVGVKYANTDFAQIPELCPPSETNGGGFDHGTHVINRMNYGNLWYELQSLPKVLIDMQSTDMVESHWVNWLAPDDFVQADVTQQWVQYYKRFQREEDRYIAKNTEQLHSQWLYRRHTRVQEVTEGTVEIDNTAMPDDAYARDILGNMVLKIKLQKDQHVSSATVNGELMPAYFEDEGFGFLYLPPLEQQQYTLRYSLGTSSQPVHVFNDGTYNIYSLRKEQNQISIVLKMYGQQVVKIKCPKPDNVISLEPGLSVLSIGYEGDMLHVTLEASDMQGKRGEIRIAYATLQP
ncbi:hypothetical protein [Chryseolinea lacunae]|uniref:Polysaccharide deacetylase n=1 Tax=Chryseolinea lacunae TaxID=2801331 RepID=A0ABS1L1H9_9BACT|nr:hypothetical protein [Chryseolinea lacunae]MBL0745303.1 hypothetical protein [Chryseolinea lacunae]